MMRKYTLIIVLIFIAIIKTSFGFAMAQDPKGPKMYIRVAVAQKKEMIDLQLRGEYRIYSLASDSIIKEGKNLKVNVSIWQKGLKLGLEKFDLSGIRIETASNAAILIDKRKFRGVMDIIKKPDGTLLLVNHVDIEEYLCGVLYHEVSHLWPLEALKAQAIASRTFALYQHQINKDKEYDLTNTTYSQVYGGATSEKYRTNKAVIRTYGEVMTYNGELFPAYFHACCGGHTEDADKLWKTNLLVLKGRDCPYCTHSPHFNWSRKVSIWLVRKKLMENGYKCGKIISFKPSAYDVSGRVTEVIIETTQGNLVIPSNKFRIMISPTLIKSTNFTVKLDSEFLYFEGKGWGHGVGLCQWGAYGMAREGFKAEEILDFYYPNNIITDIWDNDTYTQ
jgi:stage II sporulation protein D